MKAGGKLWTDYTEYIPEDRTLHNHRCENLRSYTDFILLLQTSWHLFKKIKTILLFFPLLLIAPSQKQTQVIHKYLVMLRMEGVEQWYLTFSVRVPPDIISL
jgi:hypothetical protein